MSASLAVSNVITSRTERLSTIGRAMQPSCRRAAKTLAIRTWCLRRGLSCITWLRSRQLLTALTSVELVHHARRRVDLIDGRYIRG